MKAARKIELAILLIDREIDNLEAAIREGGSEKEGGPTIVGNKIRTQIREMKGRMNVIRSIISEENFK